MSRYHEHFCLKCYPKRGGWWKCSASPCTRIRPAFCPKHQACVVDGVACTTRADEKEFDCANCGTVTALEQVSQLCLLCFIQHGKISQGRQPADYKLA